MIIIDWWIAIMFQITMVAATTFDTMVCIFIVGLSGLWMWDIWLGYYKRITN